MTGWGYGLGIISVVLFWGLLIVAVAAAIRYVSRRQVGPRPEPNSGPPSAEQLLAERFARGEIDADEYRQRLTTLREGERSATAGTRS
jgi:putative membrane protein